MPWIPFSAIPILWEAIQSVSQVPGDEHTTDQAGLGTFRTGRTWTYMQTTARPLLWNPHLPLRLHKGREGDRSPRGSQVPAGQSKRSGRCERHDLHWRSACPIARLLVREREQPANVADQPTTLSWALGCRFDPIWRWNLLTGYQVADGLGKLGRYGIRISTTSKVQQVLH